MPDRPTYPFSKPSRAGLSPPRSSTPTGMRLPQPRRADLTGENVSRSGLPPTYHQGNYSPSQDSVASNASSDQTIKTTTKIKVAIRDKSPHRFHVVPGRETRFSAIPKQTPQCTTVARTPLKATANTRLIHPSTFFPASTQKENNLLTMTSKKVSEQSKTRISNCKAVKLTHRGHQLSHSGPVSTSTPTSNHQRHLSESISKPGLERVPRSNSPSRFTAKPFVHGRKLSQTDIAATEHIPSILKRTSKFFKAQVGSSLSKEKAEAMIVVHSPRNKPRPATLSFDYSHSSPHKNTVRHVRGKSVGCDPIKRHAIYQELAFLQQLNLPQTPPAVKDTFINPFVCLTPPLKIERRQESSLSPGNDRYLDVSNSFNSVLDLYSLSESSQEPEKSRLSLLSMVSTTPVISRSNSGASYASMEASNDNVTIRVESPSTTSLIPSIRSLEVLLDTSHQRGLRSTSSVIVPSLPHSSCMLSTSTSLPEDLCSTREMGYHPIVKQLLYDLDQAILEWSLF